MRNIYKIILLLSLLVNFFLGFQFYNEYHEKDKYALYDLFQDKIYYLSDNYKFMIEELENNADDESLRRFVYSINDSLSLIKDVSDKLNLQQISVEYSTKKSHFDKLISSILTKNNNTIDKKTIEILNHDLIGNNELLHFLENNDYKNKSTKQRREILEKYNNKKNQ